MNTVEMLIVALCLDAIIGDPKRLWAILPHPVTLLGYVVKVLDRTLNSGSHRRALGVLTVFVLAGLAIFVGQFLASFHPLLTAVFAAVLLAHKSLAQHVTEVANALCISVQEGREAVSHIVGRDPAALDQSGIARSAIESAAENFSDGVIAPAFWFLIGGLPGILLYKVVNTADSMIGYKSKKYIEFGWAAARLDDVMNWVPARLTGLLIAATSLSQLALHAMKKDAGKHRSPNAGWPEAAMAATLGVALAGPRTYDGKLTKDPFVFAQGRLDIGAPDIQNSVMVLWRAWAGLVGLLVLYDIYLRTLTSG